MKKPWIAEIDLSVDDAKNIICDQFPKLNLKSISKVDEGWDNTVFKVNNKLLFRFPRRQIAVPGVVSEIKLLNTIAEYCSLNTPKPLFIGKPSSDYPWPFFSYEEINGVPLYLGMIPKELRCNLAVPLGKFLSTLHAIDIKPLQTQGIMLDTLERLNVKKRIPAIKQILNQLYELKLIKSTTRWQSIISKSRELKPSQRLCLTHGDLHTRHLLLDENKKLTGIIDWGDVHLNDPAIDITVAHSILPPEAHQIFRETYGEIDKNTWQLAQFRSLYSALFLAAYGIDKNDDALVQDSLLSLEFLANAKDA